MTTLLIIAFFVWLMCASAVALDIALPKQQPVRVRARNPSRRR